MLGARFIEAALADVARLAERLKIGEVRFSAFAPWNNVIDLQADAVTFGGRRAAFDTSEAVAL